MGVIWLPVVGYEKLYEVSSQREVRRNLSDGSFRMLKGKGNSSRKHVTLSKNSKYRSVAINDLYDAAATRERNPAYLLVPAKRAIPKKSAKAPSVQAACSESRQLTYSRDEYTEVKETDGSIRLVPKNQFWDIDIFGDIERHETGDLSDIGTYPNSNQASYAAAQLRRAAMITKACLIVAPNFRANFTERQDKFCVRYNALERKWYYYPKSNSTGYEIGCVGSKEQAKKACALLTSWTK